MQLTQAGPELNRAALISQGLIVPDKITEALAEGPILRMDDTARAMHKVREAYYWEAHVEDLDFFEGP